MDILTPEDTLLSKILIIRGMRVMLDSDLARLYGISTKRLNTLEENSDNNTDEIRSLFEIIEELKNPKNPAKPRIGFR